MRVSCSRWVVLASLCVFPLSSRSALADDGEEHHPHRDPAAFIKHFDKNGDGKLQLAELPDRLRERLAPGDTNNDGVLSEEELKARWAQLRAERHKDR